MSLGAFFQRQWRRANPFFGVLTFSGLLLFGVGAVAWAMWENPRTERLKEL